MGLPAQISQNITYAAPQLQLAVNPDPVPLYDMSFMEQSKMYDHGNRGWAYKTQMHEILQTQAEGQAMGWSVTPK